MGPQHLTEFSRMGSMLGGRYFTGDNISILGASASSPPSTLVKQEPAS